MNTFSPIACTTILSNTGLATCYFTPKNIGGAILIPAGTTYTQAQQAALLTVLQDATQANSITSRIFPVKKFKAFEGAGTENVINTDAQGGKTKVRQGKYGFIATYVNGGMDLHTAMMSFDDQQDAFDILFIDTKNNGLFGTKRGTNGNELGGFSMELIDVMNLTMNDGTNETMYKVGFYLEDPDEINFRPAFYGFPKSVSVINSLNGLLNINPVIHTANVAGLIKIKLYSGETDLADVYSTELATASLYDAVNVKTQGAITVTSVTYVAATKTFNIQLDATDADYTALAAGDEIQINIGEVSDMVTAGVVGYGNTSFIALK